MNILNLFQCKHPAKDLYVQREATTEKRDEDFNIVTYHMYCGVCNKHINISHAQMIGGVEGFLKRGLT